MAQPLLMLAHRNGALPQVFRVSGASAQTLGDPLPTGIIETGGANLDESLLMNRVIQFQGDVYAVAVNGIYKKDDPTISTGTWTQDHAFTTVVGATENYQLFGPYEIVLNGVPSLYVVWASSTSGTTWNAAILNGNTDVWSDVGEQVASAHSSTTSWGAQIVYRGVLYLANDVDIMTFDPGALSFGTIAYAANFSLGHIAGLGRVVSIVGERGGQALGNDGPVAGVGMGDLEQGHGIRPPFLFSARRPGLQ